MNKYMFSSSFMFFFMGMNILLFLVKHYTMKIDVIIHYLLPKYKVLKLSQK